MKNESKEVQFAKLFLKIHGIHVNESYLYFDVVQYKISPWRVGEHMRHLVMALTAVLPDQEVRLISDEKQHDILVNNQLVIRYFKSRWLDRWIYQCKEAHRFEVRTVDFGEFVGGLIGAFLNAMFGPKHKEVENTQPDVFRDPHSK